MLSSGFCYFFEMFQDTSNFFQGTYNLRLGKPPLSAPGGKICKICLPFVGPNVHCPEDLHYATKVKYKDKIVLELCYCCCWLYMTASTLKCNQKWFSRGEDWERECWNSPGDHSSAIGGSYYQFDRLLSPANQLHKRTHWLKGRLLASREHWWPLVFPQNHMAALLTWWWELIWPSLPQVKISTTERQLVFSRKRETVLT